LIEADQRPNDSHVFLSLELQRFQKEATFDSESPLNAENLPRVLDEFGLVCAQREIDGLLKVLNSRGIPTVGGLRRIASDERIVDIYRESETEPGTFDIAEPLRPNETRSRI
jgi:hypothetical protein